MESSRSSLGVDVVSSEQVIESETTRNVLEKQQIRWAKRGDTTPSVLNVERLQFRNTSSTLVTKFDDGKPGQQITVLGDGFTTLQNNAKIVTASGADTLLADGKVHQFTMWEDRVWREHAASGGGGGGGAGVTSFNSRTGAVTPQPGDYTASDVGATPASHLTDADPHTQYVLDAEKGVASGIPTLGLDTLVPTAQLGTGVADNTKFLRGDKTWAVPSGSGGTTFGFWDEDAPPASPNALDVDWNNGASAWPAGWIDPTGGTFNVATTIDTIIGRLIVRGTDAAWKGKVIPIPAAGTDFALSCSVTTIGHSTNFLLGGLCLINGLGGLGSGGVNSWHMMVGYHGSFGGAVIFGGRDDGVGAQSWNGAYVHGQFRILRIRRVGTNYFFEWSIDGVSWNTSGAITGSPTHIGVNYYGGGQPASPAAVFKWTRLDTTTGAQTRIGKRRTVVYT